MTTLACICGGVGELLLALLAAAVGVFPFLKFKFKKGTGR